MEIGSTLVETSNDRMLFVFDTSIDRHKRVLTGVVIGRAGPANASLGRLGAAYVDRMANLQAGLHPGGRFSVVDLPERASSERQIHAALTTANPGDAILFVCIDTDVFDATFALLNVVLDAG